MARDRWHYLGGVPRGLWFFGERIFNPLIGKSNYRLIGVVCDGFMQDEINRADIFLRTIAGQIETLKRGIYDLNDETGFYALATDW